MRRGQGRRWGVVVLLSVGILLALAPGAAGAADAPADTRSMNRFEGPLPLMQSLLIVAAHLTFLIGVTLVGFGVCHACFMRQEIRST